MSILALFILALGLSMDSFAVSLSSGVALKSFKFAHVAKIALYLSFFQAVMPILGWLLGVGFVNIIQSVDHWIAFALLLFLGGKMIYDAITEKQEEDKCCFNPTKFSTLVQMGIATSIDALAVGVSFAFLEIALVQATIIIFSITFIASVTGCYIGKAFGTRYSRVATFIGGAILVSIGLKIFLEHTVFA
ncbi:MAG: manganese efflux pump [Muribaculaceae bacterium]|nr:manganese efflux pump [Muribaculaceae bacterium]